jgi:hypothetical protein
MKPQKKTLTLHRSHVEEALIPYLKKYFSDIEAVDIFKMDQDNFELAVYFATNKKENDVKEITFESVPAVAAE